MRVVLAGAAKATVFVGAVVENEGTVRSASFESGPPPVAADHSSARRVARWAAVTGVCKTATMLDSV